MNEEDIKQRRAQWKATDAVKSGKIKKKKRCELCKRTGRMEGHHYKGYDFPLDLQWLCYYCHRKEHCSGDNHGSAKMNSEEVKKMRSEYTGKHGSIVIMAKKYGYSYQSVYEAIKKITWRYI